MLNNAFDISTGVNGIERRNRSFTEPIFFKNKASSGSKKRVAFSNFGPA
jgi:hypothetical protein